MVKKQIMKTIQQNKLIGKGAHIVLGLSGGPDSVCLFDVLCTMVEDMQWKIYPVHVNHRFRPGAAEQDQAYVENLCRERGWPCRTFVEDCSRIAKERKMTSEEAGRMVRYQSFNRVAEELQSVGVQPQDIVIAVAQNADDQAETILFRVLRGAGTDGLAGMEYSRLDGEGNRIVRPLLDCYKKDIEAYCREKKLQPRVDHTNMEPVYTRNKIRLHLIPSIEEEYNPNFKDTMIRMGKACAADRDYLWHTANEAFEQIVKGSSASHLLLDGEGLRKLHRSIRQRVLSLALKRVGLWEDLTFAHFQQCEEIVFHNSPSASVDLPKGCCVAKNYDDVKVFARREEKETKRLAVKEMTMEVYESLRLPKDSHGAFDGDKIKEVYGEDFAEHLVLGSRSPGDTISLGGGKRKKIQDYFVDRKIPKDIRDRIPLVKIGSDVLWVLPYEGKGRYCSDFKLCKDTKNVICIEIICDLC